MTLSRIASLAVALAAITTLAACNGSSNPTGPSPLGDAAIAAPSGTVKAQVAPGSAFKTTPKADELDQINGKAPLSVIFNMCAITDADAGDTLGYTYAFGDGATFSHHCRAEHTYDKQGLFEATICVHDKRLADRSDVCATYKVKVSGEGETGKPVTVSGSVTLCDEYSAGIAFNGGMCGVPGDPTTRYFFDFDSLQKVSTADGSSDFAKGDIVPLGVEPSRPSPRWNVRNGALQVDTGIGASQIDSVTCSASDGRAYSAAGITDSLPTVNVICLRTAAGRYVKYTARTAAPTGNSGLGWSGSDMTIDYITN